MKEQKNCVLSQAKPRNINYGAAVMTCIQVGLKHMHFLQCIRHYTSQYSVLCKHTVNFRHNTECLYLYN